MTVSTHPLIPAQRAVFARLKDGEGVIVDTATAFYYGLNRTGVYLWEALGEQKAAGDTGVPRGQLVRALCDRFEVETDEASRNVDEFLGQLEQFGLLVRTGG
jgi:hypothetical protein